MNISERYNFAVAGRGNNSLALPGGVLPKQKGGNTLEEQLCIEDNNCEYPPLGQDTKYRLIPRVWYDLSLTSAASTTAAASSSIP